MSILLFIRTAFSSVLHNRLDSPKSFKLLHTISTQLTITQKYFSHIHIYGHFFQKKVSWDNFFIGHFFPTIFGKSCPGHFFPWDNFSRDKTMTDVALQLQTIKLRYRILECMVRQVYNFICQTYVTAGGKLLS